MVQIDNSVTVQDIHRWLVVLLLLLVVCVSVLDAENGDFSPAGLLLCIHGICQSENTRCSTWCIQGVITRGIILE